MQTADYCLRDANENVTTAVPLFSNPKNNSPLSVCSLLFPLPHRKQEEIMLKTRHACLPLENCWDTRGRTLNTPTNSKSSNTIWGFKLSLERDREYKELLSSADIIFTGVLKMSLSQRSMFFSCFQQLHHFKTNHFSEFQVKSLSGPWFYERRPVLNAKLLVPACPWWPPYWMNEGGLGLKTSARGRREGARAFQEPFRLLARFPVSVKSEKRKAKSEKFFLAASAFSQHRKFLPNSRNISGTICCPVSGRYQYPDTWNKNSIFEAPFSVLGKRSISNISALRWTFWRFEKLAKQS